MNLWLELKSTLKYFGFKFRLNENYDYLNIDNFHFDDNLKIDKGIKFWIFFNNKIGFLFIFMKIKIDCFLKNMKTAQH